MIGAIGIFSTGAVAFVSLLSRGVANKDAFESFWLKFVVSRIGIINIHSAAKHLGRERT